MPSIKSASTVSPSRSVAPFTPQKRRLRSDVEAAPSLSHRKLSRSSSVHEIKEDVREKLDKICESCDKPNWNPRDMEQMSAVKEVLHVSSAPSTIVCRDIEQNQILEFCKKCIEQEKAGSLYVCGCPGTGKSLSVEKVKQNLLDWASSVGVETLDVLTMNCTSLTNTSEIFNKIMSKNRLMKKINGCKSPLQQLQQLYSQQPHSEGLKMMLIVADELDYLISRDRTVLHDLFMLTTFPFSKCILIGIANAIDLADRFLPRLQSLNCKPMVVCFKAYSYDQILKILQKRLSKLPHTVFQQQALELCARKVAVASGDMRRALSVCRSAIEILEAELKDAESNNNSFLAEAGLSQRQTNAERLDIVRIDHMAVALSKAYRSPVVDTIQSLPQHQQIILCSVLKFFRGGKKDTTVTELNKYYVETCKSIIIPPVGTSDFVNMCRVLNDQGLLKLGQSRDDKLKRVTLKVDGADISFALQGVRLFRSCLQ